jgi:hypothetical protein
MSELFILNNKKMLNNYTFERWFGQLFPYVIQKSTLSLYSQDIELVGKL